MQNHSKKSREDIQLHHRSQALTRSSSPKGVMLLTLAGVHTLLRGTVGRLY